MSSHAARRREGKGVDSGSRRSSLLAAVLLSVCAVASAATYSVPGFSESVVASGLTQPTGFGFSPDGRLLVLEKAGRVRIVLAGVLQPAAALDITSSVDSGNEKGLLGICFHPGFSSNGFVFLYYTTKTPTNRISRFTMTGNQIDPASEVVVLDGIDATNGNHNGGTIAIGPDGKLWAAPGDSGTGGAKSQDLSVGSLNGKVLRMELDGTPAAGNPFLADATKEPRIWAYGFRNPFRFAFRPANGSLYVADVGQSSREEIDVVTAGGNYGWPSAEGNIPTPTCSGCTAPVFDYDRSVGGSIIGGVFVTGNVYPSFLQGKYVFGDYVSNWIRYLDFASNDTLSGTLQNLAGSVEGTVSFGMGPDGYLYYTAINAGRVYRINPPGTSFYTVAPCRAVDTRDPAGAFGGPALSAGGSRSFHLAGRCGISATARSVAVNAAVTQGSAMGFVTPFPGGTFPPQTSLVNFLANQTRANNAVVTLNGNGDLAIGCTMGSGAVHVVIDVYGYFE